MTTGSNPPAAPCGLLNLRKPIGVTSRDVVDLVSRPLRRSRVKVGHAGTLDPLASGVLIVALGAATRLIDRVQQMGKTYCATIRLGATSDSLDADGQITERVDPPIPSESAVRAALRTQVGLIDQLPPQVSALKVGGRRAYDLARAGETVELAARPVQIDRVELLRYEWPHLEIEVDCGSGTYIRSIARDVGDALGCGGLIAVLTRTRIGPFPLADSFDPTGQEIAAILAHLQPAASALGDLPALTIAPDQIAMVGQGRALDAGRVPGGMGLSGEVALLDAGGQVVALAEARPRGGGTAIEPRKVFALPVPPPG